MSEITRNLRRRAPRFQIKNSDVLNVTVSKGEQASEPIDAEIVNVLVRELLILFHSYCKEIKGSILNEYCPIVAEKINY